MEFCTRREFVEQWPLVVLKELMDNPLPVRKPRMISIAVEPGSIVVDDNADGIETNSIKSILDDTIRVSSREG
jgi:hypothetical protein